MNYKRTPHATIGTFNGGQNARCQHTPHGTRNVKGGAGTITDAARITRHSKSEAVAWRDAAGNLTRCQLPPAPMIARSQSAAPGRQTPAPADTAIARRRARPR